MPPQVISLTSLTTRAITLTLGPLVETKQNKTYRRFFELSGAVIPAIWLLAWLPGCHRFDSPTDSLPGKSAFKVGLVLDKGGRDDKSFNESAFRGGNEAKRDLKINLKVVEASDDTAYEPSQRTFAQLGFDLIIGIGFAQADSIKRVAADLPASHFLIIDTLIDAPNIRSIVFNEHEGSYLVGAIAALTSKTQSVGFIGGMDIPLIRRFELGFRSGAKAIRPEIKVITNYVGSTSDAWRNPTKAQELASSQYHQNVDIIFVAAGASGIGVFDAAENLNRYAIGVDSNQDCARPGFILTSMEKRIDRAVFKAIDEAKNGRFQSGKLTMGLSEGGIDFTRDRCNSGILTPEVQKRAESIKQAIIRGEIKVPDYYKLSEAEKSP